MPIPLNEDDSLWTRIAPDGSGDFLRQFRRTACPVMGDDDVDEEVEEPGEAERPQGDSKKEDDRKRGG